LRDRFCTNFAPFCCTGLLGGNAAVSTRCMAAVTSAVETIW
jgi:hypothetical protein